MRWDWQNARNTKHCLEYRDRFPLSVVAGHIIIIHAGATSVATTASICYG